MPATQFDWSGRPVLVTGAGGFIGSHLVAALVGQGAVVRALVRYNSLGTYGWLHDLPSDLLRQVEVMQGDLRDADSILRAVHGQECVFHLGAVISIPYSYVNPSEVAAVNISGTLNVLNACRAADVRRLVHTSTSEVYGTAQYVPIDESHPLQGQSPYSASKIAADKLVESYWRTFDLPAVTVRPFNTYGPRQSARAVIPNIIAQILAGSTVTLGTLTTTRDFTYVDDTVAGFIRAAEAADVAGLTVNLGTNTEVTIGEVAAAIARITDRPLDIVSDERRIRPGKSEVRQLRSENALAKSAFGWEPKVPLEEGLARTIAWFESHLDLYHRARGGYVI
jgi:NAD dependent epimerase/dehydratase